MSHAPTLRRFRSLMPVLAGLVLAHARLAAQEHAPDPHPAGAAPSAHHADAPSSTETEGPLVPAPPEPAQEPPGVTPAAAEPAEPAAKLPPPDLRGEARSLLNLGASLTDRGDYAAGEIAFRQILNSAAFGPAAQLDALLGLARLHRRQGVFTKAAAIYEKFLKDHPDDPRVPDVLLDLGRALRVMGAPKLAISRFYSVIHSTLKMPAEGFDHYQQLARTAQFEIAETHFDTGNFTEAGKFYSRLRLLDIAPADRARAHFKSAYSQLLAGALEAAVTTLRGYLDQWPDDEAGPEARYLLATTLRQLGRANDALAVTLDLLRAEHAQSARDPRRWAYWQRRTGNQLANEFFQTGDTLNALTIYQSLAALAEDPAWRLPVTYQIALAYERLRGIEQARAAYQTIVDTVAQTPGIPVDLTELAKMAAWRLNQMTWQFQTDQQLNTYFNTKIPDPAAPAPAPAADPAHDSAPSSAATPAAL